jgi:predicted DCC family thiol-disulfide oxidoreductase YuxK
MKSSTEEIPAVRQDWTAAQYTFFRGLLGAYLFVHFVHLLPWGAELFSNRGMLPDAGASPLFHLFPNALALSDSPLAVTALLVAGACAAIAFIAGARDKSAALAIWYILACLYTRNPLIANPGLPYLGWILLAHLFIPHATLPRTPAAPNTAPGTAWQMPRPIFIAAWVVLALSYSYSGYTKLLSPSWVSGDTIGYVLQNPLARDYFLRDLFLAMPESALRGLTWLVMYVELAFAPLALFSRLRCALWTVMLAVQVGFLCLLNFADLTAPMLLFHFLTFDPAWIKGTGARAEETVYYDGRCGFCHWVVRFVLAEDRASHFRFAPLQGASFASALPEGTRRDLPDSFVVIDDAGRVRLRSDAVIHVLRRLGGLWGVLAVALATLPRALRDVGYAGVGRIRHRLFRAPDEMCPIVPIALRHRFRP